MFFNRLVRRQIRLTITGFTNKILPMKQCYDLRKGFSSFGKILTREPDNSLSVSKIYICGAENKFFVTNLLAVQCGTGKF